MPAWIVITKEKVKEYLLDPQLSALCAAALGDGQADPFSGIMQDRCNYVISRIAGRVRISATPYAVPPELVSCAALLIIETLQVRLAPGLAMKEDQVRLIRQAYDDLKLAGTPDLSISVPDDPVDADVQQGGGGAVVTTPTKTLNRDALNGL
jgi:hypothetical protein